MATCKNCGEIIDWSTTEDNRWIPLVPVGQEKDGYRTHIDSNGALRALHKTVCNNSSGIVKLQPLSKPVVIEQEPKQGKLQLELVVAPTPKSYFHRVDALKQDCPECGAHAGNTCKSPKGRERHALHRARYVIV